MRERTRDDALAHFGVKGMRWGVRNDRSASGKTSASPSKAKKVVALTTAALGGAAVTSILRDYGEMNFELGKISADAERITAEIQADPLYNYGSRR